jgi:hypothetical protein
MTLIGTLCGFGLLNAEPIIDHLDQSTPTRRPQPPETLASGGNGPTRSNPAKKQNINREVTMTQRAVLNRRD